MVECLHNASTDRVPACIMFVSRGGAFAFWRLRLNGCAIKRAAVCVSTAARHATLEEITL
jgi:hypothetical protein